jgi:hypothetical protein
MPALAPVLFLAALAPGAGAAPRCGEAIPVAVDERVELVSIVFRLAGCFEFDQPASRSPYAGEVEAAFGALRGHDAVVRAKALRERHGIGFNAVPDLAVHLGPLPELAPLVPFSPHPERLDRRWAGADVEGFLSALRAFAAEGEFARFAEEHAGFYRRCEERLQAMVEASGIRQWVRGFFAAPAATDFRALVGLLQGGANYGCSVRLPDGRLLLTPALGVWKWDSEGLPVFGDGHLPTLAHEFTHAFANPVVDAHWGALEPPMGRVFARVRAAMVDKAYPNPKIVAQESLVRGCVVRFAAWAKGDAAAEAQAREEAAAGFPWTGGLAGLLLEYEEDRERYPTLADFGPRLAPFFEGVALELEEQAARAPKVVSIEPADGSTGVDPSTAAIRVTFDRPMRDRSWSIVGQPSDVPEAAGEPDYDDACLVLTWPVSLEPGRTYRFGLNGSGKQGFAAADGTPLEPLQVGFTTRP